MMKFMLVAAAAAWMVLVAKNLSPEAKQETLAKAETTRNFTR